MIFTVSIILFVVGSFNYIVDPYGIYETNIIQKPKFIQTDKNRLVKSIKTKKIKPASICLGTSRTEYGYDPTHKYFIKPSYNLGVSGSSMYESRLYFEHALAQGNLKKVLLVADFFSFHHPKQKQIQDFETYFQNINSYQYLFSIDTLGDSLLTLKGPSKAPEIFLDNGQREHSHNWERILEHGGHLAAFKHNEKNWYIGYPKTYTYKDTGNKSFPDFEKIVKLSYKNNIELDIIFGPSYIRQWESLDYFIGYDKWLKWKKDLVISVNKIATQYGKKQFKKHDFFQY